MSKPRSSSFLNMESLKFQWLIKKSLALAILAVIGGLCEPGSAEAVSNKHLVASESATLPPSGAAKLCQTYRWACTHDSRVRTISEQVVHAIAQVNRRVNQTVRYISDQRQFNTPDHWSLPTARGGDCEDYALLKKQKLLEIGFPPQALLIATVLDKNRSGHAVLVVRTSDGDLILDNVTDRILPWAETGYLFLRMQDPQAPTRWVSVIGS